MIVLGVDPSFTSTGFALIKQEGNRQSLIHYGTFSLAKSNNLSERIGLFYKTIDTLLEKNGVQMIAIETPFLGKNVGTFLKLGYLRGVLHLLAYQRSITIVEFSAREIKQSITGFGGAEKIQVANVISMLFPGFTESMQHDITDAIAIAVCGLWKT